MSVLENNSMYYLKLTLKFEHQLSLYRQTFLVLFTETSVAAYSYDNVYLKYDLNGVLYKTPTNLLNSGSVHEMVQSKEFDYFFAK